MVHIIHWSDLHYGSREFRDDCMLNVIDYVNDRRPDMLVNTGDFTHKAKKHQYEAIAEYLQNIEVPMLNVAGNHDVKNNGIVFFERYLGLRRRTVKIPEKNTFIMGVRSPKDNTSEGELGDEQLEWMVHQLKNCDCNLRVLALHHHLVPVPAAGIKRNTLVDAGEALMLSQAFDVDLVLMGHRHVPHVWCFGDTILLYCGTSTSNKVRADEKPCFNEIFLHEDQLEVYVVDATTLERDLLISQKRGRMEYIQPRNERIDHILKSKIFQSTW